MLCAIAFLAVFAPWVAPQDPYDLANLNLSDGRLPPAVAAPKDICTGSAPTIRAAI